MTVVSRLQNSFYRHQSKGKKKTPNYYIAWPGEPFSDAKIMKFHEITQKGSDEYTYGESMRFSQAAR